MGSDLHTSAVRLTEAALQGLGESLAPGQVPAGLLLTPLARVGDALRLGVELPVTTRRWSDGLERPDLQGALAALIDETATWTFPEGESARPADDSSLTFVVRRRDETESVRHAVRRICLPKQLDPYDLAEFAALEKVLVTLDGTMGALLSRADVVRLLGTRAAMDPTWANGFQERSEGSRDRLAAPADERWPDSIRESVPSDEVMTRYATRGAMSRYVEGVAAVNEIFAGDLAACIDALLAAREDVGLVARRWRKRARVAPSSNPLRFAAIPPLRLAAATAPEAVAATTTIALGVLSPLDAEARFEVSARELTLQVFAGQKPIQRVELGGQVATSPVAPSRWELAVPASAGPIRLRVVSTDGSEFSEELHFDPFDSSHEAD
jgi:hypothetical protein